MNWTRTAPPTAISLASALLLLLPLADARADSGLESLAAKTQRAVVSLDHRVSMQRTGNAYDTQSRTAGFLIEGGYVVTSARFVEGRRRLDLRFFGGIKGRAQVVGVDPLNQIAVLKLQAVDRLAKELGGTLPALPWGVSKSLRVGQTVAALGNSFDALHLDGAPSFSYGTVTSFTRAQGRYRGVSVETDAAVNPGSFGGPLVSVDGRVVGVCVPYYSPTRWLGQAVPSDQVKLSVEALIEGKKPAYGALGVMLRSTGGEASGTGLEVVEVKPGSAASNAGISVGDRLTALEGVSLYDTADVARELKLLAPGSQVVLRVTNGSGARDLVAVLDRGQPLSEKALEPRPEPTVTRRPRPTRPTPAPDSTQPRAKTPQLGIRVQERDGGGLGLELLEVEPGGAAAKAGIRTGDLLMAVGRNPLRSTNDLRNALKDLRGSQLLAVIRRERRMLTVRIPLEPLAARPTPKRPTTPARPAPPATNPGFLGVFLTPNRERGGARIDGTQDGSPAQRAGLLEGDVVLTADGRRIPDTKAFVDVLRTKNVGDSLALTVLRRGARKSLAVTLTSRDGGAPTPAPKASSGWLGAALDFENGRVVVVELAADGPAAEAGLKPGDLIISANGRPLPDLNTLGAILAQHTAGQAVRLHVNRNGWTRTLSITLGERP